MACGIMFRGGLLACSFYVPLTLPTADDGDNGRQLPLLQKRTMSVSTGLFLTRLQDALGKVKWRRGGGGEMGAGSFGAWGVGGGYK